MHMRLTEVTYFGQVKYRKRSLKKPCSEISSQKHSAPRKMPITRSSFALVLLKEKKPTPSYSFPGLSEDKDLAWNNDDHSRLERQAALNSAGSVAQCDVGEAVDSYGSLLLCRI